MTHLALAAGGHALTLQYAHALRHLFVYLRVPGLGGAVLLP